ncbi:hypothetical protein GCT13_07135 [Paraburkholderia sp. CNPSo 3157]|uniref:Uncharacterized protein n=1 Tax=Paraburkholderia franconis TaxID=2654983 RepID=A0A7X1N7K8_9BURK|nr:hypothetical protein [Paraburkholderia franconis]MPW16714.1 hypothetical protein [Paraburkholderia franconis]
MPTHRFPLEQGGSDRLVIKTGNFKFNKADITLDGQSLLAGATSEQIKQGVSVSLPDGSHLAIKLVAGAFRAQASGLEVLRDGKPLPGSIGTPEHAVLTAKSGGQVLYFLAVLNFVAGLVATYSNSDGLFAASNALPLIAMAALLGVLGLFVQRKLSLIALGVSIAILIGDAVVSVASQLDDGTHFNPGFIVARALFVLILIGYFRTIRQYKLSAQTAHA